ALQRKTNRTLFPVYIDECHHFGNKTLREALSGLRKFGISLVLSHQYIAQLTPEMRAAILGSVGTIVSFQVGPADAEALAPQFRHARPDDLMTLPPYKALVRSGAASIELAMPALGAKVYPSGPLRI